MFKLIRINSENELPNLGSHELEVDDSLLAYFDLNHCVAVNVTYLHYIAAWDAFVDVTKVVEFDPYLHKKYLDKIHDHLNSWDDDFTANMEDQYIEQKRGVF